MEKYKIIESDIIRAIDGKKFKPGDKLPGENELCAKYNVSRVTVRKAILNLASSGKVYRRAGDGTYISEKPYVNTTGQARSFSEDMIQNGKKPGSVLLNFKISKAKSNEFIAEKLQLKKNDSFYEIERLRTGDGIPIALSYTYIPFKMMPEFDIEKVQSSLYEYFKKNVTPYNEFAYMDRSKDKIGYEIPFTRLFYKFVPPVPSEEIFAEIKKLEAEETVLMNELFHKEN